MEHCGTAEPFAHVESLQQLGRELTGTEPEHVFLLPMSWDLAACRSKTLAKGVVLVGHHPFCKLQVVAGGWCLWDFTPVQAALQTQAPHPG